MLSRAMRKAEVLEGVDMGTILKSRITAKHTVEYSDTSGVKRTRYVQTDVVTEYPNGVIELTNGGYYTPTTKNRINEELPRSWHIYQEKGQWWLMDGYRWGKTGNRFLFVEGVRLVPEILTSDTLTDGYHVEYPDGANPMVHMAEREELIKKINKYCREINKLCKAGELPRPEMGDCMVCSMFDQGETRTLAPGVNTDHLIAHLDEMYIHGSLIINALKWAGYSDPMCVYGMEGTTARAVKRYLKARLGLA